MVYELHSNTNDYINRYVLIETNEGDTPRIVVSAFSKSWTDPRRGSLPISWAIDPQLGEEFPALFDYFSSTAGAYKLRYPSHLHVATSNCCPSL